MKWLILSIISLLAINISAVTNINACATLSTANERYVLQNDIAADGKCFIISANGITLDLNGKTVTFDNAPPVNAANRGFELGTAGSASNWDQSSAPASQRTNAFPAAKGSWAPAEIQSYVMKFAAPSAEQYVYSDPITVDPNQYYVLSALIQRPLGYKAQVVAQVMNGAQIVCTVHDNSWSDLLQWSADTCVFKPTSTSIRVRLGVTGSLGGNDAYFDGIEVKTANYNIDNDPSTYAQVNKYGVQLVGRSNVRITNGKITQGQGGTYYARGVQVSGGSTIEIDNLEIRLNAPDSQALTFRVVSGTNIHNDAIYMMGRRTQYSHNGGVAAMGFRAGTGHRIYSNSIEYAPHGMYLDWSVTDFQIYNNKITIDSNAIHSYGISIAGYAIGSSPAPSNFKIFGNNITT
ncbi:MAG: hypothetical protein V1835_05855, partial [Candidatus Micrarchaeota archaeon]